MLFKNYLKKNRWTYGELAKEIGVNRITISSWDKGETTPNLYQAKKLVELLGINLEDLFIGEKDERQNNQGISNQ